jgi:hypothetical protein
MTRSKKIAKSWLAVYETLLARADKIPLLIELLRLHEEFSDTHRELLGNLTEVRSSTAGMPLPSKEKLEAENRLTKTLKLVLAGIAEARALKNNNQLTKLLDEFEQLDKKIRWVIGTYNGEIREHRILLFCLELNKYKIFEFSP